MSFPEKPPHQKVRLKTIAAPALGAGAVVTAPPVLKASDHTIDYTCGHCGTILLHAEAGQIHNLTILCTRCGSYNSTDS
jgi:DNA-directed RNA polymerase subunit RPC12/RpoP